MAEPEIPQSKSEPMLVDPDGTPSLEPHRPESTISDGDIPVLSSTPPSPSSLPRSPGMLPRSGSFTYSYQEDWEAFPPLDKLNAVDFLGSFTLPVQIEKWQNTLAAQTERVRRHRKRLQESSRSAKDRVVEEWRRRIPTADEQLDKYRKRMRMSVDRLGKQWSDTTAVTMREKVSFIAGVLNIFISGYIIGARPDLFYYWFTVQFCYFMPIRYFTYHRRGYHYFLADLCYFVNFLLMNTIWVFPNSKRLLLATYCLAYGNNAVAIIMWRNSLVFHSLDKVTSLFIHIMPPVALHCMVHLTPDALQKARFPAVYNIRHSKPGDPEHYSLGAMLVWATVPYMVWQATYHIMISIRRRDKIAAGRPTSFTWLRRSYAKTWIGKFVLRQPESLQEPTFMFVQYMYAMCTVLPCPLWFWYRWASAGFLAVVFIWSIRNGATFYIDVFGKRFQNELDQLKRDVAKWQNSPGTLGSEEALLNTPGVTPGVTPGPRLEQIPMLDVGAAAVPLATNGEADVMKDGGLREEGVGKNGADSEGDKKNI